MIPPSLQVSAQELMNNGLVPADAPADAIQRFLTFHAEQELNPLSGQVTLTQMGGEWRNQCGADAFFHICARTGLWRHRSVRFEFLPEPVGFIAYASCWFRETTEIPWSQAISIEDHARFRDYCERDFSTCTPFEVQPAPYSPDQWQPTVELQQAAMVVAARRALGGRLNGIWSVYEPSQSQLHYMQWAATHQSL